MIVYTPPRRVTSVPVIDFAGSFSSQPTARAEVARAVGEACRDIGFFYVSGHRVPQALVDATFASARRFFDLPLEEKLAIDMKNSPTTAGYEPVGGQVLDSQEANAEKAPADLKEASIAAWSCPRSTRSREHPCAASATTNGLRRCPAFGNKCSPIARRSARWGIASSPCSRCRSSCPRIISRASTTRRARPCGCCAIRRIPAAALRNQLGAGAHTDWGGVTILAQDHVAGLEIRNLSDEWIEAPPLPGTFVINLGDLMQRWTNGLYRSNMHRVKNRGDVNRHSIAFFYGPWRNALIECLPTCVSAERPAQYPPVTAQQHTREMFERSYGYAATR